MNGNFYKQAMMESPMAYAYHKIICDPDGLPCDYEFIEVNAAFEAFTGLKNPDIVGRRVTEIFPGIGEAEFDWVKIYGEVALHGGQTSFKQFSEQLNKWYGITAYSPEKYFFITYFVDVSEEKEYVTKIENLQKTAEETEILYRTDLMQEEEALLANRRQMSDIIDFLPDATLAIDREGHVIIWNKAIEKMTGIPASEMIGKGDHAYSIPFYGEARSQLMDLVYQEDEEIAARYSNIVREGNTLISEAFYSTLYDGKGAWVYAKASPLHDLAGNIVGTIESIRDISRQKQIEADMRSKTVFLEAQTDSSLDGILVVNEHQTRILTNQRVYELFNVPLHIREDADDTLLLKHIVSLAKDPLKYLEKVMYLYDHINESSRDEIEFESGMFLDRYSAPVVDKEGKYYGRIWTFRDITGRKHMEADLAREKNLLETTLRSIGDGVISTDDKGIVVLMNRVAEALTGWMQEEATGKSVDEVFSIVNEFSREKKQSIVARVLESGEIHELSSHSILLSKDGSERPVEDSAAPILGENGEMIGVVLVFRDYSAKKQKQDEILFLSYHDYLTGLYNRRFFEEELMRLDTERNLPLSIVMGDVNGLKRINDTMGHLMGDELLMKAADLMKKACRADEIVARLGGDEFVILLPKTTTVDAECLISRINDLSSGVKVSNTDVSISFGYSTKNSREEDIHGVIKNAEDHMYRVKFSDRFAREGE